ncbi:MAG TPA: bifunctional DNA-binding transcriptional regulator/O6-methylguanine-DNA methyltransferase Ada [Sphingomonas sp.]|jgi:AraC family transcriptional regulator of adaptative response/methylated-DNA-[protein]-cysteine methyltransferase|uniref:bifunctional DNA-binding transcriptional regulator/O6-methylguanine-DNA methyltransferase Ada n=1 Tax=Sphingomonas sp. TaxID=28214 RepID=UPI002EDB6587
MSDSESDIDADAAWACVLARDRAADGRFVTGVLTTGIYCRPSCAARHPARGNVRFFRDGAAARAAGLRACRRCHPDDVARDVAGIAAAVALIDQADGVPTLAAMATAAGYAPHHFHRLFRRATGCTPAAYARGQRARRMEQQLAGGARVTEAVYESGHGSASGFYAAADDRLGMTPSAWRDGGRDVEIRWTIVPTEFGPMLIAATARGVCRLAFGDVGEATLRSRFPNARLLPADAALTELAQAAVAAVGTPGRAHGLPIDVRGTAFQEAVWQALATIPAGETLSYAALAVRAGKPGAARAVGSACGANPVAVLVPCHRALRGDGSIGGYAWGLDMKRVLLARERDHRTARPGA